jgi:hypothetical protein
MRTVLAVVAFACVTCPLVAQPTPTPPGAPASPLPAGLAVSNQVPVAGAEPASLPGGKDVSRPLTMVEAPPADATKSEPVVLPEAKAIAPECVRGPLGPSWGSNELLFWWPMRQPVPPLVIATRSGALPSLGAPGSYLLVGNRSIDTQPSAGGRFTIGHSINKAETAGYEIVYFFLGTRTYRDTVTDLYNNRTRSFGLPYTNAATGEDEVLALARPGESSSVLVASTSVRVQGWEVNGVANLHNGKHLKLNGLAGWRYFQVHEGLRLEQSQLRFAGTPGVAMTADQFDAHNRFHGGQLGLHADVTRGAVFCEMTAKIAFGQTYEVVKAEGMTHLLTPGSPLQTFGGSGVYVQPSNAGRTANGVFAVVPEGTFKVGFRMGDAGRVYIGYTFICLSDAVRPGDQIDRTLNPAQVPLVNGTGPVSGADRPRPLVTRSDFWAQGLVIGLETRY